MLNRRSFLGASTTLSAAAACSGSVGFGTFETFGTSELWASIDRPIAIRLRDADPLARIPPNFMGLGYEMSSAASIGLLSVTNPRYLRLVSNLGPKGVLRIGGIVADYSSYQPLGQVVAEPKHTVVTRASLEQLSAFLNATGWTAIWSVNFAQGTLEEAVAEARDVASILGAHLDAIEIGNEVENYGRGEKPFRKPPYPYEAYRAEYEAWHRAIANAVPGVRFAAPDTAASTDWVERMAKDAKGEVQLLTTHYYRGGQRQGNAEQLTSADPDLKAKLERLEGASRESGVPWRMCETNSFFGGGLPGVSDTLLGALWTLDYMLLLAQFGCAGVNIETGVNQLGFVSSYSPIQDDGKGSNTAGVPYYGMLAFAQAIAGSPEVLPIDLDAGGINLTAYALGTGRKPHAVVVVNRDHSRDARVSIAKLGIHGATALRLLSSSPEGKTGVTLGGASVDAEGRWAAKQQERVGGGGVAVPRMSAVVLRSASR